MDSSGGLTLRGSIRSQKDTKRGDIALRVTYFQEAVDIYRFKMYELAAHSTHSNPNYEFEVDNPIAVEAQLSF